jgi:cell division protein FtsQ
VENFGEQLVSGPRKQAMRHRIGGFSLGVVLITLLFLIATSGVVWVYTGMVAQERWPIRWLEIDGSFERVSAEQVRARLAPLVTGSFFTVDSKAMRESAGEMPWVSGVTAQKTWPDTIHVTIHEYTPVAHWVGDRLLGAKGQQFSVPAAEDIQGLPWLQGPEAQLDLVFENWIKFDEKLILIGQQIERLTLDPRGSWSAHMSGGTEVKLGKGDVYKNLDMLVSTWTGLMQGQSMPPISIDLRYTNGFAVLWPQNTDAIAGNYGEKT